MSLILSLETSTSVCSVALHEAGNLIAHREIYTPQSHAQRLAPLVDEIKNESGIEFGQLRAVAIASGPGSYTGLRIGTSTAKGLCYALKIPLIAVGTLDVMASQLNGVITEDGFLCPMIDARRMEVYCKVVDRKMNVVEPVDARIIEEHSFDQLLDKGKVFFFGDGSSKCKETIRHANAVFVEGIHPLASHLGILAYPMFTTGRVEDVVHFEPYYLKDFLIRKPVE